ncbi:MAG: hypothetical protein RhofKO_21630 [Rhodothermales bacterium]
MDGTLLTILLLLAFATVLALVQARKRDKCLRSFSGFHVTLSEKGGDVTWGGLDVYTSGLEIGYDQPIVARQGHLERSFIFYKEQYEAMDALYRFPEGLTAEEQGRRKAIIQRTAHPGVARRFLRRLRNWVSMIRDALMQAASMVIGAAKAQQPGSAVLASQESQLKALSSEIIGHAGNAFDPLLEAHLFRQVVLEVTRNGRTFSYCGWLKDYTANFIEVVDAFTNTTDVQFAVDSYQVGDERLENVRIAVLNGRVQISNQTEHMLFVERISAGDWSRRIGATLPPNFTADLTLPAGTAAATVAARLGAVERVDMVVPRTHAIVRHAADGSEEQRAAPASVTARTVAERTKAPMPA